MAGFADEISHFNPYISQIPSDDYVNAGMLEQGRYDAGVQRTQSMIDNIAGVQVAGDANTQYLRDKVQQIEGKVSGIVGSDFAKNSVSNQVGQLVGQVYRDPVVQAGMTSAVRLQKYQKSWDDLRKDHPDQYSDKNKEYFDQYVNDFMKQSQTKAGLVYSGPTEATPYVDYYDKIDKQLKGMDPSIQTSISPAGEFMYRVDKSSTVSKDQIDGVVNGVIASDPRIQQQMQIDSWHSYRSFDGKQMFDHVNDSFNAMINNYKDNSKYYADVIKANPNDHETITAAQKKLVDFNTEVKNLETNRDTYLKALNEGKLDQVKQSVFNDSFRQGLILKYERNNITTDLKNNENAIESWKNHWEGLNYGLKLQDEQWKAKEYELKLAEYQLKIKGAAGGGQPVSVAGAVGADYTEDQNNATITTLQSSVNDSLTKLRKYYPNLNDTQWKQYQDVQESKYQAGDASVDPKYAQFKSITQQQRILLDTYTDVGNKIYNDANSKYNLDSIVPERVNIAGKVYSRSTVEAAMDVTNKAIDYAYGPNGSLTPDNNDKITAQQKAMQLYANRPDSQDILALSKSPDLTNYRRSASELMGKRQDAINSSFKDYGKTTSYNAQPIIGKKEVVDQIRRLTAESAAQNGDKVEADKMNPVDYFNNDQGKLIIRYQKDKDDKMYQVEVPAARNLLGNPDPYLQIARAIDISPNQSTPIDAQKALSSVNGKIKYVIQKDPMSGDYELRIWNKGALYNVPSFDVNGNGFTRPNIGSFVERIEALSKIPSDQVDKLISSLSANH